MLWIIVVIAAVAVLVLTSRMADPTATVTLDHQEYDGISKAKLVNAETMVAGAFVGELFGTGTLQHLADEPGAWPTGYVISPDIAVTYDTSGNGSWDGTNNATEADPGASVKGDVIVRSKTVAGASSYAKKGEAVFATDGQTLTLTRPADDAVPMGFVWDMQRDHTGATAIDVYVLGKVTSWLLGTAGGNKRAMFLGSVHTSALEGTAAADLFKITMYGHGRFTRVWAKPTGFGAGYTAGSQVLNLEIGTTNLTGGAVTVAYTDCDAIGDLASNIEGTAVTAANEFHDGDIVTCELAASGTGFTAAQDEVSFEIWADVEYLPGA